MQKIIKNPFDQRDKGHSSKQCLPNTQNDMAEPVSPLLTSLLNVRIDFHSEFNIEQRMKMCCVSKCVVAFFLQQQQQQNSTNRTKTQNRFI